MYPTVPNVSEYRILQIVAVASIFNKVTELQPLNKGGLYSRVASTFRSLLNTVTRLYLNFTFLSVDIIGHFLKVPTQQV